MRCWVFFTYIIARVCRLCFPHLTNKSILLLFPSCIQSRSTSASCPHISDSKGGKSCWNVCWKWEFGEFLSPFHKLHPVAREWVSIVDLFWEGTDKTHLLASATLHRKFGRSMCLDKHDLFLPLNGWGLLALAHPRYQAQSAGQAPSIDWPLAR